MKRFFLILLCLPGACSIEQQAVEIRFDAAYLGRPIACADDDAEISLTDLRFYVHNVNLIAADGSLMPVSLAPDSFWQDESVSLIDLEDGEGACLNGSPDMNAVVRGHYAGGDVTGVQFDIGVPPSLNHEDPMRAAPPLSYTIMHWHWASGYKFLRAGVEMAGDNFFLHLGSNRCEGTIGDIKGCKSANRPTVRLPDFNVETDVVLVDVGDLFADIDLTDGKRSDCQSGPANEVCAGPFARLGIDFESGEALAPAAVFRTGTRR